MNATGGQGGRTSDAAYVTPNGLGGWVQALMTVTPGETLYVIVGGQGLKNGTSFGGGGSGGFNRYGGLGSAGGGGGASDVRTSPDSLTSRVIVAGGGGGGADRDDRFRGGSGGIVWNIISIILDEAIYMPGYKCMAHICLTFFRRNGRGAVNMDLRVCWLHDRYGWVSDGWWNRRISEFSA